MRYRIRPYECVSVALLSLMCASPVLAQKVTTVPDLTGQQVLEQLANPAVATTVGDVFATAAAIEIATAPFGTSAGGFTFKLDPATGLLQRTTTSFGPSFVERALTAGEGKVSAGATFSTTEYDKLSDFSLSSLPMGSFGSPNPLLTGATTANLKITSQTVAISGVVGVSPNVDVGVVIPLVTVKISGSSAFVINSSGVVGRLAESDNKFSGLGDIAAFAKFRVVKFKGPDVPDPGGVALNVVARLPTGSRENLRGLGVGRTLGSIVASFGTKALRPHGSVGFEFWNKGINSGGEHLRHQFQYSGGVEIVAAPKLTILLDFLGQRILGAGPVVLGSVFSTPGTSAQSLVYADGSTNKTLLIPGLKVNLKGKLVLSLNALVTMQNNGLHGKVTPVAGLNLTM